MTKHDGLLDFGIAVDTPMEKTDERGASTQPRPHHRGPKRELYLARVPLPWLQRAIKAGATGARSRRTTEAALALWFRSSCSRSRKVQLTRKDLELFHLSRAAYYRALDALEDAGVVKTQRARGRRISVTLLEHPDDAEREAVTTNRKKFKE